MRKELFVNQNNTEAVEQPGNTSDSTAEGLQRGGITPAVNQALAVLPPQQQEVVKEHLASQNKYITETRQKLSQQQGQLQRDVQMSGVLKELISNDVVEAYKLPEPRPAGKVPMERKCEDNDKCMILGEFNLKLLIHIFCFQKQIKVFRCLISHINFTIFLRFSLRFSEIYCTQERIKKQVFSVYEISAR